MKALYSREPVGCENRGALLARVTPMPQLEGW